MNTLSSNIKIVKVNPTRGWGNGYYEIVERRNSEVKLRPVAGGMAAWIYAAHTIVDLDTAKFQKQWLADRAAKIGKGKK